MKSADEYARLFEVTGAEAFALLAIAAAIKEAAELLDNPKYVMPPVYGGQPYNPGGITTASPPIQRPTISYGGRPE